LYGVKENTSIPIAVVTVDKDQKQTIRMVTPKDVTVAPQ
jgi:hypothetical protein